MIETNSIKAWYLAARPKTLTAAAVPVLLGIALAYKDAQQIQTLPALLCLLFAWVMQIDSNLVNDYFDFKHGNDDETRLGPKRACAEGWITLGAMKWGIILTTLLGCGRGRVFRQGGDRACKKIRGRYADHRGSQPCAF